MHAHLQACGAWRRQPRVQSSLGPPARTHTHEWTAGYRLSESHEAGLAVLGEDRCPLQQLILPFGAGCGAASAEGLGGRIGDKLGGIDGGHGANACRKSAARPHGTQAPSGGACS